MLKATGKSQFIKMENFVEFIRAELISIFSIYENEKLRGIHTSHPIYFEEKKKLQFSIPFHRSYVILQSISR